MSCLHPININGNIVPCRKRTCLPCMQARSAQWIGRMKNELKYWKDEACFITLTYSRQTLPHKVTINKYNKKLSLKSGRKIYNKITYYNPIQGVFLKSDYQNFLHRLRKRIAPKKFKYRICGEYGKTETRRVHYHLVIFGLSVMQKVYYSESYYRQHPELFFSFYYDIDPEIKALIKDCWGKGIVHVAQVVPERIAYLEKYIEKRYKDDKPFGYEQMPTFSCGSLGMGLRYAIDNKNEIDKSNGIIDEYAKYDPLGKYVRGYRPERVEIPSPDYYLKKIFPPSRVQEIKEFRRKKVIEEMKRMGAKNPTDVQQMSVARATRKHAESEQLRQMLGKYRRENLGDFDD